MLVWPMVFKKIDPYSEAVAAEGKFFDWIRLMAAKYGIPMKRIQAIILVESKADPFALGSAGERGLMQLKESAFTDVMNRFPLSYSYGEMLDANPNIEVGTAYLSILQDRFGSVDAATQAYNVGPGAYDVDNTQGLSYLLRVKDAERWIA